MTRTSTVAQRINRSSELVLVVMALAMHGGGPTVLEQLRRSPAAASLEPLIVGLSLIVGEERQQTLQQQDTQQRLAANVFRGVSILDHAHPT